jgi:uncharacterized protein (TIRG00374 family)
MPVWLKKTLQFVIPLVLGVVILYYVFRDQAIDTIAETLSNAHFGWIIASSLAALLSHWLRALRWNMLMQPLGEPPRTKATFHAVMFGYLANLAFPRMGEVTRCGAVARHSKLPVNGIIGTVIIERAIDFLLLLVIAGITVLLNFSLLQGPVNSTIDRFSAMQILGLSWYWWLVLAVLGGLALLLYYRRKLAHLNHPLLIKIKGFARGIITGLRSITALKKPWLFWLYSLAIWLFYYLMTYLCVFAFDSTSMLNPNEGLLILVGGSFGMVAPVQGGIGAYHAVIGQLLQNLPGRSISAADALSFATLTHAAQTLLILVVGLISMLWLFLKKRTHGIQKLA